MRLPKYSSASRSSALWPSNKATSSPRTWISKPSPLPSSKASKSSPEEPSTRFVKSTTGFTSSCDMGLYSVHAQFFGKSKPLDFGASLAFLPSLILRVLWRRLGGPPQAALAAGHFGCRTARRQLGGASVDEQLNQHSDHVADHPVENKTAGCRKEEQPRKHDRHQPGHHHSLHLHRWIS